ncbi:MAG: hypothetical protein HYX92_08460 [Chloroflexi bacterium]|nr:hypothetical protein [Chloroflexota bacterium]
MKDTKSSDKRVGVARGLGTGTIASLCCVGPVVAVAMGLGGASFLLGLTAYRPYFLAFSFVVLVAGLFLLLRRSQSCCTAGQYRRHLWLYPALALVAFALTYGVMTYVVPPLLSQRGEPARAASNESALPAPSGAQLSSEGLRLAVLDIQGMT